MKKNQEEMNIADNPLYHDTWKLLKKYWDVVWSLELSVQQVRSRFEIEYESSIEDFLESVYVAGIDLSDRSIEHHAKCIERSHRMLKLQTLPSTCFVPNTRMRRATTGCCITPSSPRNS